VRRRLADAFGRLAELVGAAARLVVTAIVDLVGLAGFGATVAGVLELWGRGWALLVAGVLLLVAYAMAEFVLPLRLRRRPKRSEG
jgi:hypothetical protein